MAESSTTLHEPRDQIDAATAETHRGVVSLMEELEAIDWYNQRLDAASDGQLKAILEHNRDEEKEHAMMLLEWLRRSDSVLDQHMRTYLFTDTDILAADDDTQDDSDARPSESLDVGSLRETPS